MVAGKQDSAVLGAGILRGSGRKMPAASGALKINNLGHGQSVAAMAFFPAGEGALEERREGGKF